MARSNIVIKYILLISLIIALSACGNAESASAQPENAAPSEKQEETTEISSEEISVEPEVLEEPSEQAENEILTDENAFEPEEPVINEDPEPLLQAEEPVQETPSEEPEVIPEEITEETITEEKDMIKSDTAELKMTIGASAVNVSWEDNESVAALKELAPLTINMSMYGGFEQVGSIGSNLPRNDHQTTTSAGDIVLYSGDQIVVFYGSNSWSYTRLGRITDKSAEEMAELLGNGDVTITISK